METSTFLVTTLLLLVALGQPVSSASEQDLRAAAEAWKRGNHSSSISELERLAQNGYGAAQWRLGKIYESGQGVPRKGRFEEAVKWYRRAAEQGHSEAQNRLGDLYYDGNWFDVLRQDLNKSEFWHRRAAEQGHVKSRYKLGSLLCWLGQTVEGYAWLTVAEEAGDSNARKERARVCRGMTTSEIEEAEELVERISSSN